MLVDQVEGQQRMAQVVEDAEEENEIEALAQPADIVDRELPQDVRCRTGEAASSWISTSATATDRRPFIIQTRASPGRQRRSSA